MMRFTPTTTEAPPVHDEGDLLDGLTDGVKFTTDTLFSRGAQLVLDASHVHTVRHEGLSVIPIGEVFSDPDAVFIGFGFPNVYVAVPREEESERGSGWDRFAAFMFWRQAAHVADTKGRVQGGVLVQLRNLPDEAISRLRSSMEEGAGRRTISCANANARMLGAAGFTCGGKTMKRAVRPMKLARRVWESGLEFNGRPVELRIIRTDGGTVSDHFAGVMRKEFTSLCRAAKKVVAKGHAKAKAPVVEPRPLAAPSMNIDPAAPRLELRVGRPSRVAAALGRRYGEHPIFEAVLDPGHLDIDGDEFAPIHDRLKPYPGKLDTVSKLKRYVLFAKPVVRVIRKQMAADMESLGVLAGSTLVGMLQADSPDDPFMYNVVLTGESFRLSRLENRTDKDVAKANWVLAKHVLLAGYDPDVRYAGEAWAEDTPEGRVMHINNNSGTYKPSEIDTAEAARYLAAAFGVPVVAEFVPAAPTDE